jgi:hypothetical protein
VSFAYSSNISVILFRDAYFVRQPVRQHLLEINDVKNINYNQLKKISFLMTDEQLKDSIMFLKENKLSVFRYRK